MIGISLNRKKMQKKRRGTVYTQRNEKEKDREVYK